MPSETVTRFRTLLTDHAPTADMLRVCRTCRVPAPCTTDAILAITLQARTELAAYRYKVARQDRALDSLCGIIARRSQEFHTYDMRVDAALRQARTERDAYHYQANQALDALGAQLADVAQRMMHAVTGQPATREAAVQWLHALQREASCGGPVALAAQDDPALWTWCEEHQLHYFTDDGCARCEETDESGLCPKCGEPLEAGQAFCGGKQCDGELCPTCEEVLTGQRGDGTLYCRPCSRQDVDRDDGDPGDVLLLDREPHLYAP
jgi:hypothetical protein